MLTYIYRRFGMHLEVPFFAFWKGAAHNDQMLCFAGNKLCATMRRAFIAFGEKQMQELCVLHGLISAKLA